MRGEATGGTAELTFGMDGFRDCSGGVRTPRVSVSSFDATMLSSTWRTSDECRPPAVDEGTMT